MMFARRREMDQLLSNFRPGKREVANHLCLVVDTLEHSELTTHTLKLLRSFHVSAKRSAK